MYAAMLVVLLLAGIEVGYWPVDDSGGVEYVMQIHPDDVSTFVRIGKVESHVPSGVRNIRVCRFQIGTEALQQIEPPQGSTAEARAAERRAQGLPYETAKQEPRKPQSGSTVLTRLLPGASPRVEPQPQPPRGGKQPSSSVEEDFTRLVGGQAKPAAKEPAPTLAANSPPAPAKKTPENDALDKPASSGWWISLMLGLLGSLGGNVYLGWITWETRTRYRALVRRYRKLERNQAEEFLA